MDKIVRKAALAASSDPLSESRLQNIDDLIFFLEGRGLTVELSPYLFGCREADPGKKKAEFLNRCFADPEMEFIFDVSGGDLANTVLRHLDYEVIKNSRAMFYGFSDLTTVINAIYARTGKEAVNYQVRNIVWTNPGAAPRFSDATSGFSGAAPGFSGGHSGSSGDPSGYSGNTSGSSGDPSGEEEHQIVEHFDRKVLEHAISAEDLEVEFLRGNAMRGRVVGGNIRCLLKLAGTPFWPDIRGAVLQLEPHSGGASQMTTMLEQLLELGTAEQVGGVLLGTFTQMERDGLRPEIGELVMKMFPEKVPVARTRFVGHGHDARAIVIGKEIEL